MLCVEMQCRRNFKKRLEDIHLLSPTRAIANSQSPLGLQYYVALIASRKSHGRECQESITQEFPFHFVSTNSA